MTSSNNPTTQNVEDHDTKDNVQPQDIDTSYKQDSKAGTPGDPPPSPTGTRRSPTTLLRDSPIPQADKASPGGDVKRDTSPQNHSRTSPDTQRDSPLFPKGRQSPPPGVQTGKVSTLLTADELFGPMSPKSPGRSNTFDQAVHSQGLKSKSEQDSHRSRANTDTTLKRFTTNFDPVYSKNANTHRDTKEAEPEADEEIFPKAEPGRRHYWRDGGLYDRMDTLRHKNRLSTRTLMIERNSYNKRLMSLKAERGYVPWHGGMTSRDDLRHVIRQDHGDWLDDDLLVSASRLDSTLLRLFSDGTDSKRPLTDLDIPDYAQSDLISMEPVKWRVSPMLPSHKETLDHDLEFLQDNLRPRDVIKQLYDDDVITLMDYNMLTRTEGQGEKAVTRLLVGTLQRRGDRAWPRLLASLEEAGYCHVTGRLRETEVYIRAGMEEDRERLEAEEKSRRVLVTPLAHVRPLPSAHTTAGYDRSPSPLFKAPPTETPPTERAVQDQLNDLDLELKALHDDVTALKSSRQQADDSTKAETSAARNDGKETTKTDAPEGAQKSGGCAIL